MTIPYAIALARFLPFGPVSLLHLYRGFPSLENAFHATTQELIAAGIDPDAATTFVSERSHINPDHEYERTRNAGVSVTALDDPSYPPLLKEIPTPPLLLFHKGKLPRGDEIAIAIVGTRLATPYGKSIAYEFAATLASRGLVIISGLALGIDTACHTACVETHGRTIAVLGSGLDTIYPSANQLLADRIVETGGALLSEFPLGIPPQRHHFPMRNRIIAGLARATLVVEGPITSGALITAREALDQNREVFAIPGDITRQSSEGPNSLLKAGAQVATTPDDILASLELLNAITAPSESSRACSQEERVVLDALDKTPRSIDDVVQRSMLSAAEVLGIITTLELTRRIRDVGGGMYVRV